MGSVLAPFWNPFGLQDRSKIGPKIIQKLSCSSIPPQDRPERPQDLPKIPQEVSRSPQEAPKTLPRGSKRAPRPPESFPIWLRNAPKWSQETSFFSNWIFPIFYLCSRPSICLYIRKDSTKLSKSHQEASKSFANQHIIISELPSLQVSECPVSSCLGGIREAQTIFVQIRCSYMLTSRRWISSFLT